MPAANDIFYFNDAHVPLLSVHRLQCIAGLSAYTFQKETFVSFYMKHISAEILICFFSPTFQWCACSYTEYNALHIYPHSNFKTKQYYITFFNSFSVLLSFAQEIPFACNILCRSAVWLLKHMFFLLRVGKQLGVA